MSRDAGLRNFLLIWFGQMISAIGSRVSSFAMGMWILQTTGSTMRFALTFVVMQLPALLVGPFAGALVDRWDRRRLMICCEVLAAANMVVLAALLASGTFEIWHIYVGVAVSSLCDTFRSPAFFASVPLLATREQLPRVNGLIQTGDAAASILGPLLAGVLVGTISLQGIFIVDAITFLVAAAAMLMSRIAPAVTDRDEQRGRMLDDALLGWRFIRDRRGLQGLLALGAINSFIFALASILITPLLMSFANVALVGVQFALGGIGLLLGGLAVSSLGVPRKRVHGVSAFSALGGLCLALHGVWPSFALVSVAGCIFFMILPVVAVSSRTLWQSKVPIGLQGRCYAVQEVISSAVTPIGYLLAGPISEYLFQPLLVSGGALAGSVGLLIGVGPGRGVGLLFIVLGLAMSATALAAYGVPAIRNVDALPDAATQPRGETLEEVSNTLGVKSAAAQLSEPACPTT